jgi:hypothetical protein
MKESMQMTNKPWQRITTYAKDNPKDLLRWVVGIFAFNVAMFLMFYLMFALLGFFGAQMANLFEKYPLLEKVGLLLSIIFSFILVGAMFAIAAFVASPFLPSDDKKFLVGKLSGLWHWFLYFASTIGIVLGIAIVMWLLYRFVRWIFVVPPPAS